MAIAKLDNKHVLRRLLHIPKTIECGLHSGFPPCCVSFYVREKMWLSKTANRNYNTRIKRRSQELGLEAEGPGYIPCPDCLRKGSFVEVKDCPDDSCWHADECAGDTT